MPNKFQMRPILSDTPRMPVSLRVKIWRNQSLPQVEICPFVNTLLDINLPYKIKFDNTMTHALHSIDFHVRLSTTVPTKNQTQQARKSRIRAAKTKIIPIIDMLQSRTKKKQNRCRKKSEAEKKEREGAVIVSRGITLEQVGLVSTRRARARCICRGVICTLHIDARAGSLSWLCKGRERARGSSALGDSSNKYNAGPRRCYLFCNLRATRALAPAGLDRGKLICCGRGRDYRYLAN